MEQSTQDSSKMERKNGNGTVKWTDGSSFQGDFVKSTIHGKGKYKWSDGREYDGNWENGKMHGKGVFTWPDGKYYDGEYKNDKKDGYGKYFWDGKCYEGTWFNGKQNGYGAVYVNNELVLKGFWRYGKILKKDFEKKDNSDNFSILTNDHVNVRNLNGNTNTINTEVKTAPHETDADKGNRINSENKANNGVEEKKENEAH